MTAGPKGWKSYPLGELALYVNGKAFKPEEWKNSGLPIIRIQNLTDRGKPFNYFDRPVEERYRVKDGDMLVSWSATLGSFIWDRGPAVLNQHIFKVIPKADLIEKEFLHYLMLSTLEEIAEHTHGIAMKHITKEKFENIEVFVPAFPEQRRLIAIINQCMENLEEIGRLERGCLAEAIAVLPSILNETFQSVASSAPLRTIGDLVIETRYGTSQKCHSLHDGTPILRIPNVAGGEVNFENLKYCNLTSDDLGRVRLEDGDLLFVRTNGSRDLVGRCAVFEGNGRKCEFGFASYLIRVRLNKSLILPKYLAFFLNSTKGREEINKRRRTSAGQFNINSENLRTISVPLPSLEDQNRILRVLVERESHALQLVTQVRALKDESSFMRESVLRKAFAGEL